MSDRNPLLGFSAAYDYDPVPGSALSILHAWRRANRLGFLDLPGDMDLLELSIRAAFEVRFEHMIVAGIGGSSLGLRALLSALGTEAARTVHILDSPDTELIRSITAGLDRRNTAVTVITKSGGTSETLSIFLQLHSWLPEDIRDERITVVTDPSSGDLGRIASDRGWKLLPVPSNIGGRFSVLSPVGLYPAAFAGIDVRALLRGAETVSTDFAKNGVSSLAGRVTSAFFSNFASHPIHVFMPYSDRLSDLALWFAQLWAESLGKKLDNDGQTVNTGQTPLACRGPADQHSLLQLFMEGPADKAISILTAKCGNEAPTAGVSRVGSFEDYPSLDWLDGRSPDVLRGTEAAATASVLSERGLPVDLFTLERIDAESIGELLMTLEIAAVLTGLALDINPLDQPGVEKSKILTYRAMGRAGY
jgi:glucose-6-phosphate isomerase